MRLTNNQKIAIFAAVAIFTIWWCCYRLREGFVGDIEIDEMCLDECQKGGDQCLACVQATHHGKVVKEGFDVYEEQNSHHGILMGA